MTLTPVTLLIAILAGLGIGTLTIALGFIPFTPQWWAFVTVCNILWIVIISD
jgi:hypothetical protein